MKPNIKDFRLKRIDIYIIKKFLGTYFLSIVLILSIAVVFDLTEKLDNFFDNNAPLKAIVFDYYLNFIPFYMNMFSPLFTFIAVIFFTSKMAANTEIIAILASGVSFRRLMLPYFVSALVIASIAFVLGGYILSLLPMPECSILRISMSRNLRPTMPEMCRWRWKKE